MSEPLFRYPAAIVIWNDAHARNQAVEYTEDEVMNLHRAEKVTTLGLVIKEDNEGISLYCEETGPDSVRGANFIPAAMIEDVIRLGHLKRPRRKKTVDAVQRSTNKKTVSQGIPTPMESQEPGEGQGQ